MIDPATGWFEITQIPNKESQTVAEAIEQTWLSRYHWPNIVILDRGTEFMRDFTRMMQEDYGVRKKPIKARTPQANAIIERVHQTIDQMIRAMEVQNTNNINDPLKENLITFQKNQDLLMKLEGFQWATSLDLNMGY